MRVLVTIPHCYRPRADGRYGSQRDDRTARCRALRAALLSWHRLFGKSQYVAALSHVGRADANQVNQVDLHIAVCTSGEFHVLDELGLDAGTYQPQPTNCDPMLLGFECHALLRDALGQYDYYCYSEDDLIVADPWLFVKLQAFTRRAGPAALLQPNRFEYARGGSAEKAYIDGELALETTAKYQDVSDRPQVVLPFLTMPVVCCRTSNPHAGAFFLNAEQMEAWAKRPYFLDRDCSFYSALESAATLGIMRTFRIYKPAPMVANFFEIEHAGDMWLRRIKRRDAQSAAASDTNIDKSASSVIGQ